MKKHIAVLALHCLGTAFATVCDHPSGSLQLKGLGHNSFDPTFRDPFGAVSTEQGIVRLRFRACANNADSVKVLISDARTQTETSISMSSAGTTASPDLGTAALWETRVPVPSTPTVLYYRFEIRRGSEVVHYLNQDSLYHSGGWGNLSEDSRPGYSISVFDPNTHVPDWLKGAVIYQIFPDRFRNGDPENDPENGTGWIYGDRVRKLDWDQPLCDPRGSECPDEFSNQFYGGDLSGIVEKLPYLQDLGVTSVYLNPIFRAPSNHRYDTQNYTEIDPALGNLETFHKLTERAKAAHIRIVLDGVFNHTSADSPYFDYFGRWNNQLNLTSPLGEGRPDGSGACESPLSPFRPWYSLPDEGTPAYRSGKGLALCPRVPAAGNPDLTYEAYAGLWTMPRLQSRSLEVRNFFYSSDNGSVAPFWIGQGASGWRLDVAAAIDPGLIDSPNDSYWRGMRQAIRKIDPEAILVGEHWGDAAPWLLDGRWDSAMNYRLRSALLNWMFDGCDGNGCSASGDTFEDGNSNEFSVSGPIHAISEDDFEKRLRSIEESYPRDNWLAMMNLIGSHDTNRILFLLSKISLDRGEIAARKLRLLFGFLFTYPGSPTIYYGDEAGLSAEGVWDGNYWQGDPYCRGVFPWRDQGLTDDTALHDWVRDLIRLRKGSPALRFGGYRTLLVDNDKRLFAFERSYRDERVWVVLNRDKKDHNLVLPEGGRISIPGLGMRIITDSGGSFSSTSRLSAAGYKDRSPSRE